MINNIVTIGRGSFLFGLLIALLGVYGGYHLLRLFLEHTKKVSEEWNSPSTFKAIAFLLFQILTVVCLVLLITA